MPAATKETKSPQTFRCGICGQEKNKKQLASTGPLRGPQCQGCHFAEVDRTW
jgi:hypothetical protein